MGRKRQIKFGPRLIDIDILFFNSDIIDEVDLKVPHPEIKNRRFVLVPLNEIAAHYVHPVLLQDISTMLSNCTDSLPVRNFL